MRPHLSQLVLHAGPDAAEVDRVHPVEVVGGLVGGVAWWDHDPGVVERHVEPAQGSDGAVDEGGDLVFVRDVAWDAQRLMTCGGQLVGCGSERIPVDVGERDAGAVLGECARRRKSHPGACPGHEGNLTLEVVCRVRAGRVHDGFTITLIASRSFIAR